MTFDHELEDMIRTLEKAAAIQKDEKKMAALRPLLEKKMELFKPFLDAEEKNKIKSVDDLREKAKEVINTPTIENV